MKVFIGLVLGVIAGLIVGWFIIDAGDIGLGGPATVAEAPGEASEAPAASGPA